MTVDDLIKELSKYPKDLEVIYQCYSEHCLLEKGDIWEQEGCLPRGDGWVHDVRPDQPFKTYLRLPGN